jgi:hypothetical protein
MTRIVNIAAGVLLAGSLSQFPEFSQQYVQRLGGAVDGLSVLVRDFDKSAEATGQSREEALSSLTATEFLSRRQDDMRRTIGRHENLIRDYENLREANVYLRLAHVSRYPDGLIAGQTWADFQPAVPLTLDGLALTMIGYLSGYGLLGGLFGLRREPRKRRLA